jgi:hypothetical protein
MEKFPPGMRTGRHSLRNCWISVKERCSKKCEIDSGDAYGSGGTFGNADGKGNLFLIDVVSAAFIASRVVESSGSSRRNDAF